MDNVNTFKKIMPMAILLGCASIVYWKREDIKKFISSKKDVINKKGLFKLFPSKNTAPFDEEIGEVYTAMADVQKAFLMYADNFRGLYETMHKGAMGIISQERTKNVLTEWDIRMENIPNIPIELKSWWATVKIGDESLPYDELQNRAKEVIEMIKNCGVVRDNRSEFVAEEDTSLYYQESNDAELVVGQKLHIDSPCWYMATEPVRIIEKGYCEII